MTRLLIVNADDFGLSLGVNEGIVDAHTGGIVTSTSLMVLGPAARGAADAAGTHRELSLGLHFVEPEGVDLDDPAEAQRAFRAQLERFRELTGNDPTHVDSHHHVHAARNRMATFTKLVAPLGAPLRHDGRVAYIGGFWGQRETGVMAPEQITRSSLLTLVKTTAGEGFSELGCHPARIKGDFHSSYLEERAVELATLTAAGLQEELERTGVKLVSFKAWRA